MENNWLDFFQGCIDDLELGSGWLLADKAIAYLESDKAKEAFDGISVSTRDAFIGKLLEGLKNVVRNNRALVKHYMQQDNKFNTDKSLHNCTFALYDVFVQAVCGYCLLFDSTFKALSNRGTNLGSLDELEEKLVEYYADLAMIDLDDNMGFEDKIDHKVEVENNLNDLRNTMFSWLVSRYMIEDDKDKIIGMTLSTGIDSATKQLLVSALTLSCFEFFEYAKFSALVSIFNQAEDSSVRIKALVGVMLCLQFVPQVYEERVKRKLLTVSRENPAFMKMIMNACKVELHALNKQEGRAALSKQLFSTFMESSKMMRKEGQEEEYYEDEDEEESDAMSNSMIEDVFHMLEGGTDIYFSQFKNKKKAAFFHSVYNWFMPFGDDSVGYLRLLKRVGEKHKRVVSTFLKNGRLCDSDQFSFVYMMIESKEDLSQAFEQVKVQMDKMEENGVENPDEVLSKMGTDPKVELRQIISYIHDLSRFYELAPMRSSFSNPFEEDGLGCFQLPLASDSFENPYFTKYRLRMARYCLRKNDSFYIPDLLKENYPETEECHFMLATAYFDMYEHDYEGSEVALPHAEWLMKHAPNNFLSCATAAGVYIANDLYDKAEACWKQALEGTEDEEKILDAKEMLGKLYIAEYKYGDAAKIFYELNYKNPASTKYMASLVNALLLGHPSDKATVKKALDMLRSFAQNYKEPDPISCLLRDEDALKEDSLAKSFSKFMGAVHEYMHQDHSMDCKLHFLEGICMWVLIEDQDEADKYSLEDVIKRIYEDYHEQALPKYELTPVDEHITAFTVYAAWLRSFGISNADMALVDEIMRQKFNRTLMETKKMIENFKNGKLK